MKKQFFYILNIIFITLYVFPGSIFGLFLYGDLSQQPNFSEGYFLSINHLLAFSIVSTLGCISIKKNYIFLFLYLIILSVVLEFLHILIPNREFELPDLFGNIIGVLLGFITYYALRYLKNEFFRR